MNVDPYVRPDLRDFAGYTSPAPAADRDWVWLNANESPYASAADAAGLARRYPEPQPDALREALAALNATTCDRILIGRGSDELIDLLVRLTCRPGADAIAVSTPTFPMYEVAARLHGAAVVDAPLRDDPATGEWIFDTDAMVAACDERVRLVFVCSPGNPTGGVVPLDAVAHLADLGAGRFLVAVDEAYVDFSAAPSAAGLLAEHDNLVILRTLSKAHALAGARVGYALAAPELIAALGRVQTPFPVPQPVAALGLAAAQMSALGPTLGHILETVQQRERLLAALRDLGAVAYSSQANFVLVRLPDPDAALAAFDAAGIVVRDARSHAALPDALRISVGTPDQNDRVVATLAAVLA